MPLLPAKISGNVDAAGGFKYPLGIRNTAPFDVLGVPAISIPCGFTMSCLPIVLQIAAAPFAESTVLALAHAYEQETEFQHALSRGSSRSAFWHSIARRSRKAWRGTTHQATNPFSHTDSPYRTECAAVSRRRSLQTIRPEPFCIESSIRRTEPSLVHIEIPPDDEMARVSRPNLSLEHIRC